MLYRDAHLALDTTRMIRGLAVVLLLHAPVLQAESQCSPPKESGAPLIAWIGEPRRTSYSDADGTSQMKDVGPFRPIARLAGTSLIEASTADLKNGQAFWSVLDPKATVKLASAGSFLDELGEDHCVYFASVIPSAAQWTLLSSKPLPNVFRKPTAAEMTAFAKEINDCVVQGDPEPEKAQCSKPQLLAVTDINQNGQPELWATEPYKWDTGLTVWEREGKKLAPLLQVCPGCSD